MFSLLHCCFSSFFSLFFHLWSCLSLNSSSFTYFFEIFVSLNCFGSSIFRFFDFDFVFVFCSVCFSNGEEEDYKEGCRCWRRCVYLNFSSFFQIFNWIFAYICRISSACYFLLFSVDFYAYYDNWISILKLLCLILLYFIVHCDNWFKIWYICVVVLLHVKQILHVCFQKFCSLFFKFWC